MHFAKKATQQIQNPEILLHSTALLGRPQHLLGPSSDGTEVGQFLKLEGASERPLRAACTLRTLFARDRSRPAREREAHTPHTRHGTLRLV